MVEQKTGLFGVVVRWFAHLLYVSSLTALIPFASLMLYSPAGLWPAMLGYAPLTAIVLLVLSVAVLFFYYHNVGHVLASLGWMTFVPGIAGFFFVVFRMEWVFALFEYFAGPLAPVVRQQLENALPTSWLFIIGYVVIGFVLLKAAGGLEREHVISGRIRKFLGSRWRITSAR